MSDFKVSACIPTYNRAHYLKCAITSVLEQSEPVDEIVIVDDGSTDNTAEVVKNFGMPEKIKYYLHERGDKRARHVSLAEVFNFCIDKASGEFVSIIGDDDMVSYDWCKSIKETVLKNNDASDVYFFSCAVIGENNKIRKIWKQSASEKSLSGIDSFVKTNMMFGLGGNCIFKKKSAIDIGKLSTDCGSFFDKDFFCRLTSLKIPLYFSPRVLFFSRMHAGQTSSVILHGHDNVADIRRSFLSNGEYICRICNKYKDFFLKEDRLFKLFSKRNYFSLFGKLFTNSMFFREISFLYVQGLFKGLAYRDFGMYRKNCTIIAKYFGQSRSLKLKLFLLFYFLRYWVYFINIKGGFLAFFPGKKDKNLLEVT